MILSRKPNGLPISPILCHKASAHRLLCDGLGRPMRKSGPKRGHLADLHGPARRPWSGRRACAHGDGPVVIATGAGVCVPRPFDQGGGGRDGGLRCNWHAIWQGTHSPKRRDEGGRRPEGHFGQAEGGNRMPGSKGRARLRLYSYRRGAGAGRAWGRAGEAMPPGGRDGGDRHPPPLTTGRPASLAGPVPEEI